MQHEEGEAEPGPQAAEAEAAGPPAAAAAGDSGKASGSGKAADRAPGRRESGEHEEEGEHTGWEGCGLSAFVGPSSADVGGGAARCGHRHQLSWSLC